MKLQIDIAAACERAGRYLRGRECPQGGFCFYRSALVNEPNLADTWHAVSALQRLGMTVARPDRLAAFLSSFPPSSQPWDLFHLTGSWRALDPGYAPDRAMRKRIDALRISPPPPRDSPALAGWLERTGLVLRLRRDYGSDFDGRSVAATGAALAHDGGFGAGPGLLDTWLALDLLQVCKARCEVQGMVDFIERLQIPAFGFGPNAGSHAGRLELVWAGVNCCRTLERPVRYARDAVAFVLACQVRSGGFASAPDALPDIQNTHRALDVLAALAADRGGASGKLAACCAV
jgi:hypothetical protein